METSERRSRRQHEAKLIQRANVMAAHLWRGPNDGLPVLSDLQCGEEAVWPVGVGFVLLSLSPWGRKSEREEARGSG